MTEQNPVTLEQEYQKREQFEAAFEAQYPEGFDRIAEEIEAL